MDKYVPGYSEGIDYLNDVSKDHIEKSKKDIARWAAEYSREVEKAVKRRSRQMGISRAQMISLANNGDTNIRMKLAADINHIKDEFEHKYGVHFHFSDIYTVTFTKSLDTHFIKVIKSSGNKPNFIVSIKPSIRQALGVVENTIRNKLQETWERTNTEMGWIHD